MAYKLVITEHAHELLDKLVYHLIYRLKNEQSAEMFFWQRGGTMKQSYLRWIM